MNLPAHVLSKDLRRWWPLAAFAGAFIIVETLAPLWGLGLAPRGSELGNTLANIAKWPVVFILVVVVMQEDRTVGDHAFWRTRPIAAGPLLTGKLVFFALTLALPSMLANIGIATSLDTPGPVTLGIAVETVGFTVLAVLAAALLAAITSTLLHAALAALGGLFAALIIGVARDALSSYIWIRLPWDTDVPYPGPRIAFACGLACVALIALLAHQVFTRRTGRTVALLAVALPAVLATAVRWTFDYTRPSLAAAFPAKPLAQTEGITITVEPPARLMGTDWVWDAPTRRHRPERNIAAYADLNGAIPGRFFEFVEGTATLGLRDGRELNFPAKRQYDYAWSAAQRDGAIRRALGLEAGSVRGDPSPQGLIRIFSLPPNQLEALGGAVGRLTMKLVLGETAFRETFRLPVRLGALHREPGLVWRIEGVEQTDEAPVQVSLRFLRATTMLAPRGESRADVDPNPTGNTVFYLVNRKRGDYAVSWGHPERWKPGIVASSRMRIAFNTLRLGSRKVSNQKIDASWLADAELIVLRTEHVGKTEKVVVVENFEVPRPE